MKKIEIKKSLYKQKPEATFNFIRKGVAYYTTELNVEGEPINVNFEVPVDDMGDADFFNTMSGQLLNRWIVSD